MTSLNEALGERYTVGSCKLVWAGTSWLQHATVCEHPDGDIQSAVGHIPSLHMGKDTWPGDRDLRALSNWGWRHNNGWSHQWITWRVRREGLSGILGKAIFTVCPENEEKAIGKPEKKQSDEEEVSDDSSEPSSPCMLRASYLLRETGHPSLIPYLSVSFTSLPTVLIII